MALLSLFDLALSWEVYRADLCDLESIEVMAIPFGHGQQSGRERRPQPRTVVRRWISESDALAGDESELLEPVIVVPDVVVYFDELPDFAQMGESPMFHGELRHGLEEPRRHGGQSRFDILIADEPGDLLDEVRFDLDVLRRSK